MLVGWYDIPARQDRPLIVCDDGLVVYWSLRTWPNWTPLYLLLFITLALLHSTISLVESTSYGYTVFFLTIAPYCDSVSTWLYFIFHLIVFQSNIDSIWLYFTLLWLYLSLLEWTLLHSTKALLDSICDSMYTLLAHTSLLLCVTQWHVLYYGFTWLCLTVLNSTMAITYPHYLAIYVTIYLPLSIVWLYFTLLAVYWLSLLLFYTWL